MSFKSLYTLYNSLHNPELESEIEQARKEKKDTYRLKRNFVNSFSNLRQNNVRTTKRFRGDSEPSIAPRSRKVPSIEDRHRQRNEKDKKTKITNSNDCSGPVYTAVPQVLHDDHFFSDNDDDGIPDFDEDSASVTKEPEQRKSSTTTADLVKRLDIEKEKNKALESELIKLKQDISSQEKINIIKQVQGKSQISILRENVELRRKMEEVQKANRELEPKVKELKKVRKLLIAKIQIGDNESEETDDENLMTFDTLHLLKKYEEISFRHNSRNSESSTEKDTIIEKLETKVTKLKAKNERLKTRASNSDNSSLTLKKLEELQYSLKIQANEPEKVKELNEALTNSKTKLNLQRQINGTLEEQQQEMMEILGIPKEERSFAKCLNALKSLQETLSTSGIKEQNEVKLYDNAEQILQSLGQE